MSLAGMPLHAVSAGSYTVMLDILVAAIRVNWLRRLQSQLSPLIKRCETYEVLDGASFDDRMPELERLIEQEAQFSVLNCGNADALDAQWEKFAAKLYASLERSSLDTESLAEEAARLRELVEMISAIHAGITHQSQPIRKGVVLIPYLVSTKEMDHALLLINLVVFKLVFLACSPRSFLNAPLPH